jgi:NAD(P)-dependent dehydrogenase (short-subunit alcohol dehydrogenase family)
MNIQGSVAVVTGGASGIGRATALALADAGADVVVSDIDEPGAQTARAEIEAVGRRALVIRTDVGRREEVEDLIAQAIAWQGRCDIFLSNAGVGCRGYAHEFSAEEWESILAVDLMASIWAMRLVVPHMLERDTGHISFVSSGAGLQGIAKFAPYCVAKFGLVALAESLARELKATGVEVSLIVPGAVATNGWRGYRLAGADGMGRAEIEAVRESVRAETAGWPTPESMAAIIVDGIASGRFFIAQPNPFEPDWLTGLFRKRAEDPDGFVLGD